jgi:hypothetical protein
VKGYGPLECQEQHLLKAPVENSRTSPFLESPVASFLEALSNLTYITPGKHSVAAGAAGPSNLTKPILSLQIRFRQAQNEAPSHCKQNNKQQKSIHTHEFASSLSYQKRKRKRLDIGEPQRKLRYV